MSWAVVVADAASFRDAYSVRSRMDFGPGFDDFGLGVSLDPCDAEASDQIENIRKQLLELRETG